MTNYLFIDGSYFIFFRYYSIMNWFKLSHKGEDITDPINNLDFVNKFKSTFLSKINEITEKLNINNPVIIVGKDTSRKNIWRMKHLPTYKGNRDYTNFHGGPFFKMAYEECLFYQAGAHMVLEYDKLEADDIIAITTKYILETREDANIHIITSDMDYLQLQGERVKLFNLKYKSLLDSKHAHGNAELDLFIKIVTGDKSDNIKSVFKKCGPKTALKLFKDKDKFREKLEKENGKEQYELNKLLIDFNNIPKDLVDGFRKEVLLIT